MVQKTKFLFASLMMLGCSFCFTSCSSDDDDVTKEPVITIEIVKGEYSGKMDVIVLTPESDLRMAAEVAVGGTNVSATIKNDTVFFEDFPIKSLVELMVPEEEVDEIVQAAGKVSYKVGYKASFNAAQDSLLMELDPKPLELTVSLDDESTLSIKMDVSVAEKGIYSVEKKKLVFEVKAYKVTIDDEEIEDFEAPLIKFDLNQK